MSSNHNPNSQPTRSAGSKPVKCTPLKTIKTSKHKKQGKQPKTTPGKKILDYFNRTIGNQQGRKISQTNAKYHHDKLAFGMNINQSIQSISGTNPKITNDKFLENKLDNPYLKIKNNINIGKTKSKSNEIIVVGKLNPTVKVKNELSNISHIKQEIRTLLTENYYDDYSNGDIFKKIQTQQITGAKTYVNVILLAKLHEIPNRISNNKEYKNGDIYKRIQATIPSTSMPRFKECEKLQIKEKINQCAINITQNNLQKAILPTLTLNYNLETEEYNEISQQIRHIACLQEPYCPSDTPAILPKGYKAVYSGRSPKPRALILISRPYDNEILRHEDLSNRDTTTISIKDPNNKKKRLFISSAYMPHEEEIKDHLVIKVLQEAEKRKFGAVICADTNAHSTIWGNERNNSRGCELETIIAKFNLSIENTNLEYTRSLGNNESTIDLTLTNQFAPSLKNWQLLRGVSDSDHEIIQMQMESDTADPSNNTKKDLKNCNINQYREDLQQLLISNPCKTPTGNNKLYKRKCDIDHVINTLTKHMKNSFEAACPEISTRNKPKNFWTRNIKSKHRRLIKARKRISYLRIIKWREKMFQESKEHRKGKKIFRKIMLKAHKKAKIKFFESIKKAKEVARLGKIIENKGQSLGTLLRPNGTYTVTPEDTLNTLADQLLGQENKEGLPHNKSTITTEPKTDLDKIFSIERLRKAIKELKRDKTPGKDGITNEMIIEGADIIQVAIITIFKSCMAKGYVPKTWQNSNGAIIAKPGKSDYTKAKSFRIITLSSNLLKLMEKLVLWHLQKDLKIEQSINKNQYGFRSGHATDTAVAKLIQKIENALLKPGNHALGIFLDINGAFDNLPFNAIKDSLDRTEAKGLISNWITYMVSNRHISLTLANTQITRFIPKGCPQGGVLSPFLWNLVLNDLLNNFSFTNDLQAFADDLNLVVLGCDISTIWDIAEAQLKRINNWCTQNGLQISEVKTQVVFWTKNYRLKYPNSITVNKTKIQLQQSAKYLGITIDKYLNWNEHIDKTVKNCIKCIFAAKKAIGKKWGLTPANIKWLYTMVIRPKISYGAVAWGTSLSTRNTKQLNRVQHLISTLITNAHRSTAQEVLDLVLDLEPIGRFVEKTALLRATTFKAENQ